MNKLIKYKNKLIAMGLLGIMIGTSGCQGQDNQLFDNGTSSTITINNNYYYKRENIYIIMDKNGNCQEFFLNNDKLVEKIYDIENSNVIFANVLKNGEDDIYYNYLENNLNVIFFKDLEYYLPHDEIKNYYSLKEIKALEYYLFNISNDKHKSKVLVK